ncbi:MAG: WecB/TagA/CpsF family glycosyltransferase [Elusimicrobia bacterium]|nr:WecB/TagA/CpsF family glycosyltransferase [Elusimicrobiota bacterium]
MTGTFKFMNILFHALSMSETLDRIDALVRERTPRMFFSLSAELISRAQDDSAIRDIYGSADIVTADSFVVYYSARLCGIPLPEPVSASRVMCELLPNAVAKKYRLYLLGASEEVVARVVSVLRGQYPGITIVGWRNGYFTPPDEAQIVADIRQTAPDILFVAMSSPLKEQFISKHLHEMGVPVSMGVGGIFDIIAGKCRLAPPLVSRCGLEWLYRFLQEPRRMWKRYLITNAKYLLLLGRELLKRGG